MANNYHEPEDLLSDESFLDWYFDSGRSKDAVWDSWLAEKPGRSQLVNEAITLLDNTRLLEKDLPEGQRDRAEQALLQKIAQLSPKQQIHQKTTPLYRSWRWIAAACILPLAAGLFLWRPAAPAKQQLTTQFGQIKDQLLPDGTEVTMNANSNLQFSSGWQEGIDREVWLTGEAFFHVRKTPEKSRFIVHTDHFDIVVTGTRFNVVNRSGRENVLLREGGVTLEDRSGEQIRLAPGDFAEWGQHQLQKRPASADSLLAWTEKKLVLDKTPLRELIGIIKDQYGIRVELADSGIADSTVSGIIPNGNLEVLLKALEATSDFDVKRADSVISIRAHSK